MNSQPIGIFDSGVGGLSVLKELVKLMPKEHYVFVADQINVPYGEKTNKELEEKTLQICDFLISKKTKIIIVACNTATCNVIDFLRNNIRVPLVGTVPAVKSAATISKSNIIGILSTPATSKSKGLRELIRTHANNTKIINIGCPNLENTVEIGNLNSLEIVQLLIKYTQPIKKSGADVIVLGCTHYPFLKPQIKKIVGKNVKLIDSGRAIAKHTKNVLQQMGTLNSRGGETTFYTTGDSNHFSNVASSLLKRRIQAKHISL